MKRTVILQISLTPYRSIVFNELAKDHQMEFRVLYANKVEPHRKWIIEGLSHDHAFLKKQYFRFRNHNIYFSLDVLCHLWRYKPDVIMTYGFNPVMLLAWCYSVMFRKKHIVLTDSWLLTIEHLSRFHKLCRRVVFRFSERFLAVGKKGIDYLVSYGVESEKIYVSQLVADNDYYAQFKDTPKKYDFVFSGQFIERKMPFFIIDVLKEIKMVRPQTSILLIGSGELEKFVISALEEAGIAYTYPGFIQQSDLPSYYAAARLLLFPTMYDCWGLVANEASAVGVPVITCDNAGAAGDLIVDGYNGYVLPLEVDVWAKKIMDVLNDEELYRVLSDNALKSVDRFTPQIAAMGIVDAIDSIK